MNKQITTIILLITFALFCKGASFGMLGHMAHMQHSMNHTKASCCAEDIGGSSLADHHDITLGVITILILAVVVWRYYRIDSGYTSVAHINYVRSSLQARGSPQIPIALIQLFKTGILHPKTW